MIQEENTKWTTCSVCLGRGRKRSRVRKKRILNYEIELQKFNENGKIGTPPTPPIGQLSACLNCDGSGLEKSDHFPEINPHYPHIAIVGGGIGGIALAVACLHRGIPFTLFERDASFNARSQGYGLTLQQASKAIKGFGITALKDGLVSKRHAVHTTEGEIIGEWGNRKWGRSEAKTSPVKSNVHIARQSLRLQMLNQLGGESKVQWNHKLIDIQSKNDGVSLTFAINGKEKKIEADLVVGADGIRSTVRNSIISEQKTPLNYLGCIVILGICPLDLLENKESSLLDNETVFQTVNGVDRMYMMPYTENTVMWQFSFPLDEQEAIELSKEGAEALKKAAQIRTDWHHPVPDIVKATPLSKISGYPVYDRALLQPEMLTDAKNITLLGDAAHPMSPFKGQGANQALLDALSLSREITIQCRAKVNWRETGLRDVVLSRFEAEMITRSSKKVKDSAIAVKLLHSDKVLEKGDRIRGRLLNQKKI